MVKIKEVDDPVIGENVGIWKDIFDEIGVETCEESRDEADAALEIFLFKWTDQ